MMIRGKLIKVISFVFAIWYLLCVVGFDVHTCGHSGRSFVSSLVMNAAADAKDDVACHFAGCCEDGESSCCGHDGVSSGCSDDVFTLSAPAIERSEDEHHHHSHCTCVCGHCPALSDSGSHAVMSFSEAMDLALPDFSYKEFLSENIQSLLSVWRI